MRRLCWVPGWGMPGCIARGAGPQPPGLVQPPHAAGCPGAAARPALRPAPMSRPISRGPIAAAAGLLFVLVYVVGVTTLPDLFPRLHWALEALYWVVAGTVWVFPVTWLMLWAAGKR